MTTSKHTKKALLASVLSMLVCASMLVGSTFAWFTDSVTSGKNQIVAGNLDVEMYSKNTADGTYEKVRNDQSLFNNNALWEPGYVEYVNLKVANLGTLALEYKLDINVLDNKFGKNVYGENFNLAQYIKFAVIDEEKNYTSADRAQAVADAEAAGATWISELAVDKHKVLAPNAEDRVTLVIYMPTSVGNVANHGNGKNDVPHIDLGVTLLARQTPAENDSFGPDYDANADYAVSVTSADEFSAFLKQGKNIVLSKDIDVTKRISHYTKGVSASIDLGSSTITVADKEVDSAFKVSGGAVLTLKGNGTVYVPTNPEDYCMAVSADGGQAVVNIESGTYTNSGDGTDNQYDLIYAGGTSAVNISGGTFKCQTPKWTLNVRDKDNDAHITVTGGMFYKFDPVKVAAAASSADDTGVDGQWYVGADEIIVPEGYTSVRCDENGNASETGDWYKVVAQ